MLIGSKFFSAPDLLLAAITSAKGAESTNTPHLCAGKPQELHRYSTQERSCT